VRSFGYPIEDTISKGNQAGKFWQQWHKAEDAFKQDILQTCPQFEIQELGSENFRSLSDHWLEGDFTRSKESSIDESDEDYPVDLVEVRHRCEEARTVELSYVAYRVKETFYQSSIDKWDGPVEKLLNLADDIYKAFLTDIVNRIFKQYSVNGLHLKAR